MLPIDEPTEVVMNVLHNKALVYLLSEFISKKIDRHVFLLKIELLIENAKFMVKHEMKQDDRDEHEKYSGAV